MSDKTLQEEAAELRERSRDLGYELAKALGLLRLLQRLDLEPKPWVREREIRDLHKKPPA